MENLTKRFLKYVSFNTQSNEESNTTPSTKTQLLLANEIVAELKELNLEDISIDDNGYIMATLPANRDKDMPTIGFIAHMDTSPDMPGNNVKPNIIKKYDGDNIMLNKEKCIILSTTDFPEIKNYIGGTIITTDGTTLLGADDKAGIAEIITAMEYLINHPEVPHGNIRIGFTPDEEIGAGSDHFDVNKFNADFAYTIDGGELGELEYENFNAAEARIIIKGTNIHPGTAKNKMINSMLIANEFISMLPQNEVPENTEGYEGFYHLISMKGGVEETELHYIIRDFDKDNFEKRKLLMDKIVNKFNVKYGKKTLTFYLKNQYYNMKEKIEPEMHIVETAKEAMEQVGVLPIIQPIRGGTDGARLSYMGLPCPNIFTGGHNFHGKFEYIPVESMVQAVEVIVKIVELYSKKEKIYFIKKVVNGMNVLVLKDYEKMSKVAANMVADLVKSKPNCILGLATGSTPVGMYEKLIEYNKEKLIDFSNVISFNLDEYLGLKGDHPQSYRYFMDNNLFDHININKDNTHVPSGTSNKPDEEGTKYDKEISEAGGIDLQILGIGNNGHIGFNEPSKQLIMDTHVTDLTKNTIEVNSRFFNNINEVPTQAVTMGLGSIMKSKQIILLASGSSKANIISSIVNGKLDTEIPASLLQVHPNVTIIVDESAGKLILNNEDSNFSTFKFL